MRTKYKKLLKVRKYVYVYKAIEGYTLVPDDTLEKHQFETFVWLDLLTEKITFNLFSVSKRKFKLKGVLKFEVEQTDNFDLLKDRARAFSKAHLQKLAIENNTVVFGEVSPEEIAAFIEYQPPAIEEVLSTEEEKVHEPEQKQYDIPSVVKIQKCIRGHLARKKYFYYAGTFWETIFSKNFRFNERLINFKVLQQMPSRGKAEKSNTPVYIIYGMDLTVRIEFDSIPFPCRAVNPKRVTLQRLQEMLTIDIYSHTLELLPEYVVKPAPDKASILEPNLKKSSENELSRSETLKYISREHLHTDNTMVESESKKQLTGSNSSLVPEEDKEEEAKKNQKMMKRKHRFAIFVMRQALYFGDLKTTIIVFWLPQTEEVLVELHRKGLEAHDLILKLKDLNLHRFHKRELSLEFDLRFLPYVSYEDDCLVFNKGGEAKRSCPMSAVQRTT